MYRKERYAKKQLLSTLLYLKQVCIFVYLVVVVQVCFHFEARVWLVIIQWDNLKILARISITGSQESSHKTMPLYDASPRCPCTTWNCHSVILPLMEDAKKRQQNVLSLSELDIFPRNSTPGGFICIWQSKWVGKGCNIVPTFELRVALKIVLANRLV